MKKITAVLVFLVMAGCYEPDKTSGTYKVTSESAVEIHYTDGNGDTQRVTSAGGEWNYTVKLEQDKSPDPFWFTVYVISTSGQQDISIYAEFEESNRAWLTISDTDVDELEYSSVYCPPWTTQCAKVNLHF